MKRTIIFSIDVILWALAAWLNSGHMQMRLPAGWMSLLFTAQAAVTGWLLCGERPTGRRALCGALAGAAGAVACALAWAVPTVYVPQGATMALQKGQLLPTALCIALALVAAWAQKGAWVCKVGTALCAIALLVAGCAFLRLPTSMRQRWDVFAVHGALPLLMAILTAFAVPQTAPRSARARILMGCAALAFAGYATWMLVVLTQFALGMSRGNLSPRYLSIWVWGVRQALPITAMYAAGLLGARAMQRKPRE